MTKEELIEFLSKNLKIDVQGKTQKEKMGGGDYYVRSIQVELLLCGEVIARDSIGKRFITGEGLVL